MIAHVVLYTPKPDLPVEDRAGLQGALSRALEAIPSVRRYQVGRRIRLNAAYEAAMRVDYEFFAMIEFDDRSGLEAYLEHREHVELGRIFYEMSAHALAYDYEIVSSDRRS